MPKSKKPGRAGAKSGVHPTPKQKPVFTPKQSRLPSDLKIQNPKGGGKPPRFPGRTGGR